MAVPGSSCVACPGRSACPGHCPISDPSPGLGHTHSRTGKIARLPVAIRQELNGRLRDGQPGRKILDWLNGLPEVQAVLTAEFQGARIGKQNLSQWRKGGYQESVQGEEMRQEIRLFMEQVGALHDTAPDGLTEQLAFYLAALAALELKQLKSTPESPSDGVEKAKIWREVRSSLVALRRGDIDLERLRLQREKYGLRHQTQEEREAEFWKWAEENINRDEFCRRRCFTAEEREAAMDKILGITPEERGEITAHQARKAARAGGTPGETAGETGGTESEPVPPGQS